MKLSQKLKKLSQDLLICGRLSPKQLEKFRSMRDRHEIRNAIISRIKEGNYADFITLEQLQTFVDSLYDEELQEIADHIPAIIRKIKPE